MTIQVTEGASRRILSLYEADPDTRGKPLRISVQKGGCSGFEYNITFDQKREGDAQERFYGFSILLDSQSVLFLKGSTLDFVEEATGAGFKIGNPNVTKSCACGQSYS